MTIRFLGFEGSCFSCDGCLQVSVTFGGSDVL